MGEPKPDSTGRDFTVVAQDIEYPRDRAEAMQPGDYIDMPGIEFKTWSGREQSGNEESLKKAGEVRVRVVEVLKNAKEYSLTEVVVEAAGVRKKVSGSLFFNRGQRFVH